NPFFIGWRKLPNELKEHVFGFISLSDVISFADVALSFRHYAVKCLRHRLTLLIEPYALPLYSLLLVLDRSNSVIGGSLALELVHPTGLIPNNLDLYCPNQEADDLCGFLLSQVYDPVPDTIVYPLIVDDTPGRNCIEAVRTLHHPVKGSTIHIIISDSSSALPPIYSVHSTFLMNFVSANGIYSCYPSLTERNI
ncbi:hypothetical protein DFP72DRAFT_748644, partial [Ephemerocybe angulata]